MKKNILKSDVISIFEEIAKKYSQKIAVADDKKSITYAQLDNLSNTFAKFLISENIQPKAVIPIIVDRSINDENLFLQKSQNEIAKYINSKIGGQKIGN